MIAFQDPLDPQSSSGILAQLADLGWVDKTALGVLLVFFVLGLFKGLIWQVSRIGILIVAYMVAGWFGHDVAGMLSSTPVDKLAQDAMATTEVAPGETTLYLAYCLLFVAVLIVLSLLTMLIKKLADKAGLGFFDRLGGGVVGVATGACVVLAGVFVVNMFFPRSKLAEAADSSHSLRWSQQAIDWLGGTVNDDLRSVLALQPLNPFQPGQPQVPEQQGPLQQGPGRRGGLNLNGQPMEAGSTAGLPAGAVDGDYRPPMPSPLPLPPGMQPGSTATPQTPPPEDPGGKPAPERGRSGGVR